MIIKSTLIIINIIDFWKYLIIGLIQGLTEPLPISSSGHMIIFEHFLNINTSISFQAFVNIGSLLAIIIYYRKFLYTLITESFKYVFHKNIVYKKSFTYVLLLVVATIPAAIIGYLFSDVIDSFCSIITVIWCLGLTGIILLITHNVSMNTKGSINLKSSISMGFGQILGLLPGISRSGVTSMFGCLSKASLEESLRFSFLMYIPISIGAGIVSLSDITIKPDILFVVACISSFIGTLFSISMFFKIVKKNNLKYFAIYCIILALLLMFII